MREDRRRRYDDGFRREALELIKSGAGKDTLARRLAIPVYTARNWIGLYRSNGEEAVMGGGGSRRYDWETKVAASRDHVENGLTKAEVMAMHGIASVTPLERWCREYRAGGPEALGPRPKGRPRGSKSKPKTEPTREQELAERVRPPAGAHVPGPRVRHAHIRQDRARGHAPYGLRCAIRSRNPWRRYSSYRGETGDRVHNLPERDFDAARPFSRLGTDVTEFKVAGSKAYLAPVYDMASKEIVAWDVSRSPDLGQQKRLPAMPAERLPAGAEPILHSDMGWQYQHQWWRKELERPGIRRSMSRKGNCLDNAAAEQVFGHLKDEVLPRPRVRLVRAVQGRAGRVHRALEHQTTARYDSRDAPRRSSGACPPRSDPVSQLTTSNKRGAIQSRGGVHRLFLEAFGFFWWWS